MRNFLSQADWIHSDNIRRKAWLQGNITDVQVRGVVILYQSHVSGHWLSQCGDDLVMCRCVIVTCLGIYNTLPCFIPTSPTLASSSRADRNNGQLPVTEALGSLHFLLNLAYGSLLQDLDLKSRLQVAWPPSMLLALHIGHPEILQSSFRNGRGWRLLTLDPEASVEFS